MTRDEVFGVGCSVLGGAEEYTCLTCGCKWIGIAGPQSCPTCQGDHVQWDNHPLTIARLRRSAIGVARS